MDKKALIAYFEAMDRALQSRATLYIYGSAACILLDEPHRTSLDVDVAGPYSVADERDLRQAAEAAGLPINPDEGYSGDHIEWVGPLRLCLQPPMPGKGLTLWEGARLQVRTGDIADLVSSKLIRYDDLDRSDVQYLLATSRIPFAEVERAVERLPTPFAKDPLIHENLKNLKDDMAAWGLD
ncbi:MAG: hypothetical protein RBS80_01660 [Thermoguttaceae bacterium]|jgi:hypothetical protein|nr:hypothetical protein [Thermoguttaceae bacterium]